MDKDHFRMNITVRRKENVSKYLDKYFRCLLKDYIQEIIPKLEDVLGVKSSGFKIRKLKNAYGCCNKDGLLKFDPILYRKSKEAVKTVVLHELCHIKEFNHKGEFSELMEKVIPDCKRWDSQLRFASTEFLFI